METEPTASAAPPPGPDATIVRRRRRRRRRRSSGSHRSRTDRLVQAEWAVALTAAAVAVFFQLVFLLHAGALWRDEVNSINTASASPFGEVWRLAEFESFPLPWILALRAWVSVGLGGSDMALRVFGVLGGLALPAAVWFALRRLTRAAPLASLALIAVNPEIIRWSGTVRAWGLGAALAIVAMVLVREASVALTRRRLLYATLAAVLAVQCTYQNAVFLAAVVLAAAAVAIVRRRWAEAVAPIGIGAIAAVSLLPYAGLLGRRAGWNAVGQVPVTLGDLAAKVWEVATASGSVVVTCGLALFVMGLVAAVQWAASPEAESANRARRGVANYAAAAAILSALAIGAFYRMASYPAEPWYCTGVLSFVAVCAEVAVASAVAARVARISLVVLAAVVLLAGFLPAWAALHERQTNMDAIAARLDADADRADLIVVNPWFLAAGLTHYYTGGATVITVPPIDDHRVPRYDLLKAAMLTDDPLGPSFARIQHTLESGRQVWIVGGFELPIEGTSLPRLPVAPRPDTGWSARPYERAWLLEASAFLGAHAIEGGEVPVGVSGGRFETVGLAVFKGWK
jgi:hypothetical protein